MPAAADGAAEGLFAEMLERYLGRLLHVQVRVKGMQGLSGLPAFVKQRYQLLDGRIAGRRCVFMVALQNDATPAELAKHLGLVRAAAQEMAVFATQALSAHYRARLIQQGTPFVVPDNQLYLPELAMDLRDRFRAPRLREGAVLPPAAQAVLFHQLLHPDAAATTPTQLAPQLGYSAMSIGRAFDALTAASLADTVQSGKERRVRFKAVGRQLLQDAEPLLSSPVRAARFVASAQLPKTLLSAGESALAQLTDLAPPPIPAFAIAARDWKPFAQRHGLAATDRSAANCLIETWAYSPAPLANAGTVDSLSLHAQFRAHPDERLAQAAATLLEQIQW